MLAVKKNIGHYLSTNRIDILLLLLLTLLFPLFFYKLGQSSLGSWDEAWYAEISRNILRSGDWFNLIYNGTPFTDKPPGGFWISALIFKFFGISDLTARLSQAVAGMLCLYITYILGAKLFTKVVGFAAALSLSSAYWFLYRSRSGNLDILLTLSMILTILLAIKAAENKRYFIPFILSLTFLPMIKGIVFVPALIPSLLLIFWKNKLYTFKDYLSIIVASVSLFGFWIVIQFAQNPELAFYHFSHSARDSSLTNDFINSLKLFKEYLHNGIGKWFWPGVLGVILSILLREKRLLGLGLFIIFFSIQFLFSPQVHIWHLIPLYPFMVLIFYGSIYYLTKRLLDYRYKQFLSSISILLFAFYFSSLQIRAFWYQSLDIPAYISDEAILSAEAGKHQGDIFLDGDFEPAGAYYAGKPVTKLKNPDLVNLFATKKEFLLITNEWRLKKAGIDPSVYKILKTDRDKVLIEKR